jgi:hypothetical protein
MPTSREWRTAASLWVAPLERTVSAANHDANQRQITVEQGVMAEAWGAILLNRHRAKVENVVTVAKMLV